MLNQKLKYQDNERIITKVLSEVRLKENKTKSGVYLGVDCTVPVNGVDVPVFISDYVLMGYGTGAVMSVPGQDQRDWDFATLYGIDIIRTVEPPRDFDGEAYVGEGPAINSDFLDGLLIDDAKNAINDWLEAEGHGSRTTTYKLRDWLFSRQRYWGEPFPIIYDEVGLPIAVPEDQLPVELPELIDWAPRALDENSDPEPPLGRAEAWVSARYDLGDGRGRRLNSGDDGLGGPTLALLPAVPETRRLQAAGACAGFAADPDGVSPTTWWLTGVEAAAWGGFGVAVVDVGVLVYASSGTLAAVLILLRLGRVRWAADGAATAG